MKKQIITFSKKSFQTVEVDENVSMDATIEEAKKKLKEDDWLQSRGEPFAEAIILNN